MKGLNTVSQKGDEPDGKVHDPDVPLNVPLHGFVPAPGSTIDGPITRIATVSEGFHVRLFVKVTRILGHVAVGVHQGKGMTWW